MIWAWTPAVELYRAQKDPIHPSKKHYRFFHNPWLESGAEQRLDAWAASSLRPGELTKDHEDLSRPGARFSNRDSLKVQGGVLVLTEERLIHEAFSMRKPRGSRAGKALEVVQTVGSLLEPKEALITLIELTGLRSVGPIMCKLCDITSLTPIADSALLRIEAPGIRWYVSTQGTGLLSKLEPAMKKRDEMYDVVQRAVAQARTRATA